MTGMRVAYDHQIFSRQAYGGISRYFIEIAKRMRQYADIDVNILSPLHINHYLLNEKSIPVQGRHVADFPKSGRVREALNRLLVSIDLHKTVPDILHATYYDLLKHVPRETKTVITIHDMTPEKLSGRFDFEKNIVPLKLGAVRKADHVICISHNTRNDLIDISGIDPGRVSVVHFGCNIMTPGICSREIIDSPFILFVGLRGLYKNFNGLLQAYARSKWLRNHFKLLCFGGGPFTKAEQAQIAGLGLSEAQVMQRGGGDVVLAGLYSRASAFVYPSLYEGFGMPLLEAMSLRCPVLCSRGSAFPEIAGEAAEYFDPEDPDDMAAAIEKVVSSSDRAQDLTARGLLRAAEFSWERCAEETRSVYLSLA